MRGGKREGSGRKRMTDEDKKIPISFRLAKDVVELLKKNRPATRTLEQAVREFVAKGGSDGL